VTAFPKTSSRSAPADDEMRDDAHKAFIRLLPCCGCGRAAPSIPAHLRLGTDGGMGMKPSDCFTTPLCDPCHSRFQHQRGERTFWQVVGIDPKQLAAALFAVTGDVVRGRAVVMAARALATSRIYE
jgi:hypothetical protein